MKEKIINKLSKLINKKAREINEVLEVPPQEDLGDYSFPCFILSKELKKSPVEIAENLKKKIEKSELMKVLEKIETKGPYLNFFMKKQNLAQEIIQEILEKKQDYGKIKNLKSKKIMVEFPSPNTNKPLHLGHLRNMSIGESVSRILEFAGEKVIRANLNNDRGIHVCKSMLAYQKFGKNKKPDKKSDHFVGDFYVLFNKKLKQNPELEDEAKELLKKWENNNEKTRKLWKKMNKWAFDGFQETYKTFGIKFDKEYYESKLYKYGKKIVEEGLRKHVFEKTPDGAVIIDLRKQNLDQKVLLRPDKTSLYITQDLYLAKVKQQEFKLDGSIYVVGNEQIYHFNVLFNIIKKLKLKSSADLKHLSYGMVELPEGKMKSREGTIVDADDLIEEVRQIAETELKKREKLSKKELKERSLTIALAAIKYFLLKINMEKNMKFNPKESINFDGNTGPYILYSYARANSIIKKSDKEKSNKKLTKIQPNSFHNLESKEFVLIKKLGYFPEVFQKTKTSLNPSIIANYAYELSHLFSEFYRDNKVVGSEYEARRLQIVESFKIILKTCMNLLGIEVLERM